MIEYIRTIIKERKSLPKKLRYFTDGLAVLSIFCGGFVYVNLFLALLNSAYAEPVLSFKDNYEILFWFVYLIGIVLFYSIGQFIVLGIVTFTLCLMGKLTAKESCRYTFYYRLPVSWLGK